MSPTAAERQLLRSGASFFSSVIVHSKNEHRNGEDDTERKKREARANALKTVTDDEREETEGHSKCRCVLM